MSSTLLSTLLTLLIVTLIFKETDAQFKEWCIADEQTPDDELQKALDWACGKGGADCSKLQVHQPCFLPNTVRDHASYAFNSYYQKYKRQGATCYFNAAAIITDLDPSFFNTYHFNSTWRSLLAHRNLFRSQDIYIKRHGSCKFEALP